MEPIKKKIKIDVLPAEKVDQCDSIGGSSQVIMVLSQDASTMTKVNPYTEKIYYVTRMFFLWSIQGMAKQRSNQDELLGGTAGLGGGELS